MTYLIANWKMTGSRRFLREFMAAQREVLRSVPASYQVVLCPPAYLLCEAAALAEGTRLAIGGQDCDEEPHGAHTGDISAPMLSDAGCCYVILGHSERRRDHRESDALIGRKLAAAVRSGLMPVLCVGETGAQAHSGARLEAITGQLGASLRVAPQLHELIIAYEPVWAIGAGATPEPDVIAQTCQHIADYAQQRHGVTGVQVLYGGSVDERNAGEILRLSGVGGLLVGGASTDAQKWTAILRAAKELHSMR